MNIITRLAFRLRRARLAVAEQDLVWLEKHAPAELQRRREQVKRLRARLDVDLAQLNAAAIVRRVERQAKRPLISG